MVILDLHTHLSDGSLTLLPCWVNFLNANKVGNLAVHLLKWNGVRKGRYIFFHSQDDIVMFMLRWL